MNGTTQRQHDYRRQIGRFAQSLAVARNDDLEQEVAVGYALWQVKMFTDGNLDKRYQKLVDQLELLEDEFDDLEDLIVTFVKTVPLAAYDTGSSDGERFLQWLIRRRTLTPEQQDIVLCQRSRYAIECIARGNRVGHIHFQEILSSTPSLLGELGTNPTIRIHLNPIRVWSEFRTPMLLDDDEAEVPVSVLFYAMGNDIHTAMLESEAELLVCGLERLGPCTLPQWEAEIADTSREDLIELTHDLSKIGLVALG